MPDDDPLRISHHLIMMRMKSRYSLTQLREAGRIREPAIRILLPQPGDDRSGKRKGRLCASEEKEGFPTACCSTGLLMLGEQIPQTLVFRQLNPVHPRINVDTGHAVYLW